MQSAALKACLKRLNEQNASKELEFGVISTLHRELVSPENHADVSKYYDQCKQVLLGKVLCRPSSTLSQRVTAECLRSLFAGRSNDSESCWTALMPLVTSTSSKQDVRVKLGALRVLGSLVRVYGYQFLKSLSESVSAVLKLGKHSNDQVRALATWVLGCIHEGVGGAGKDQSEQCLRFAAKASTDSKSVLVRSAAAGLISTMVRTAASQASTREFNSLVAALLKRTTDESPAVRYAYARALGTVVHIAVTTDLSARNKPVNGKALKKPVRFELGKKKLPLTSLTEGLQALVDELTAARDSASVGALAYAMVVLCERSFSHPTTEDKPNVMVQFLIDAVSTILTARDSPQRTAQVVHCVLGVVTEGVLAHANQTQFEKCVEVVVGQLIGIMASATERIVETSDARVGVCVELLSHMFCRLGVALNDLQVKDLALAPLLHFLSARSPLVRVQVAQCFRQLSRAASLHISTWLTVLTKVSDGIYMEILANGVVESALFYSLHGHVYALGATLGTLRESPTGVPSALLEQLFELASKLRTSDAGSGTAKESSYTHALRASSWYIFSGLIGVGEEWIGGKLNSLFAMFKEVLGAKTLVLSQASRSRASAGKKADGAVIASSVSQEIVHQLKEKMYALMALRTFVRVFRKRMVLRSDDTPSAVLKPTLKCLKSTLGIVKTFSDMKECDSSIKKALVPVKSLLYDIFAAIPPRSFSGLFSQLIHWSVADSTVNRPCASNELDFLLNPSDSVMIQPVASPPPSSSSPFSSSSSSGGSCSSAELCSFNDMQSQMFLSFSAAETVTVDLSFNWCFRASGHTYSQLEGTEHMPELYAKDARLNLYDDVLGKLKSSSSSSSTLASEGKGGEVKEDSLRRGGVNEALVQSLRNNSDRFLVNSRECVESEEQRAVNAAVRLFSNIYHDLRATHQTQLLSHCASILTKADPAKQPSHANVILNIACMVLGSLREIYWRSKLDRGASVLSQQLCSQYVELCGQLLRCDSGLTQRAAGESLSILVVIDSTGDYLQLVTNSIQSLALDAKHKASGAAAFALSAIHRTADIRVSEGQLPLTIASFQTLSRQINPGTVMWILQSLYATVLDAGQALLPYIQAVLAILRLPSIDALSAHQPSIHIMSGRIARACLESVLDASPLSVAETSTNADWMELAAMARHFCFEVMDQGELDDDSKKSQVGLPMDVFTYGPERIQETVRMLRLSAVYDHKLTALAWEPVYLTTMSYTVILALQSPIAEVRLSAVQCLTAWGARRPDLILKFNWDLALLRALNGEQVEQVALETRAGFSGFINASFECSTDTSSVEYMRSVHRILKLCKDVLRPPPSSEEPLAGAQEGVDVEDGEEEAAGEEAQRYEWWWNTKVFALESLILVLSSIYRRKDELSGHFNVSEARKMAKHAQLDKRVFVVCQLNDLLNVGAIAAGSSFDDLRCMGISMLHLLVQMFQSVPDPEMPDSILLSLYQTHVSSTLRQSLKDEAFIVVSPRMRAAACGLACAFLSTGMVTDRNSIDRAINLLLLLCVSPEQQPGTQGWLAEFDESLGSYVTLAHLRNVSSLLVEVHRVEQLGKHAVHPAQRSALKLVKSVLKPRLPELVRLCVLAVRDYATLIALDKKVLPRVQGRFFRPGSSMGSVLEHYRRSMHVLLPVATLHLGSMSETQSEYEGEGADFDLNTASNMLLGTSMKIIYTYNMDKAMRESNDLSPGGSSRASSASVDAIFGSPAPAPPAVSVSVSVGAAGSADTELYRQSMDMLALLLAPQYVQFWGSRNVLDDVMEVLAKQLCQAIDGKDMCATGFEVRSSALQALLRLGQTSCALKHFHLVRGVTDCLVRAVKTHAASPAVTQPVLGKWISQLVCVLGPIARLVASVRDDLGAVPAFVLCAGLVHASVGVLGNRNAPHALLKTCFEGVSSVASTAASMATVREDEKQPATMCVSTSMLAVIAAMQQLCHALAAESAIVHLSFTLKSFLCLIFAFPDADALQRGGEVLRSALASSSHHVRVLAMKTLVDELTAVDARVHTQPAVLTLLESVLPGVFATAAEAESDAETAVALMLALAVVSVMLVVPCSSSEEVRTTARALVCVFLPLFLAASQPAQAMAVSRVVQFAQNPITGVEFKAGVGSLDNADKQKLQAVLVAYQQQEHAKKEQADAKQAAKTSHKKHKKKKRR